MVKRIPDVYAAALADGVAITVGNKRVSDFLIESD
jgi:hypothetical protein